MVSQDGARTAPPVHGLPWMERIMKRNVGGIDRTLRVLAGLVLIALAGTGVVGAWGWIGVVPLATGLIGWCPAYRLVGLDTCPLR